MRIKTTQAGDSILILSVSGSPLIETSTELYATNVGEDIAVVKTLTFLLFLPKVDSKRKTFGNDARKLIFAFLPKHFPSQDFGIQSFEFVNRDFEFVSQGFYIVIRDFDSVSRGVEFK